MEKYARYNGIILFVAVVAIVSYLCFSLVSPLFSKSQKLEEDVIKAEKTLVKLEKDVAIINEKIKSIQNTSQTAQKKIFAPIEGELGNDQDSLFFTLYNDVLEMLHTNSIKIKAIDYKYNPSGDPFVENGRGAYFVCDVNMDLVSNYKNLGKLIEQIYQYPYYIKISSVDVKPYKKDKTILITKMSLRLYASTDAVAIDETQTETAPTESAAKSKAKNTTAKTKTTTKAKAKK